jgi:hypothetical protein
MAIGNLPSSCSTTSKAPQSLSRIPTLSDMANQIRSIADIFHQQRVTIDQMSERIQRLEQGMRPPERNITPRRRKIAFLPKLASGLTKLYFIALFAFILILALSIILMIRIDLNSLKTICEGFYRAGALLLLLFCGVAVQQSIR